MPVNDEFTYEVGFGKPPKNRRFQKGASGNPKGRPKGRRNLATVLEQTLQEKVIINENGIRKAVTKLEAAIKQLVNKAASGDLAAMRQLTTLANAGEVQAADLPAEDVADTDLRIMQSVLKRLERAKGESNDTEVPK
jgi:Family of unknown function (DUF5681)